MELEVIETTKILSSKSPFQEDHILPLSHLDNDRNLRISFRYLRVYTAGANRNSNAATADPFAVISAAISEALVYYYPFAGSLRLRGDDRFELFCAAKSKGVPLIRAKANCTLEAVNFLDDPTDMSVNRLAPDPGPDDELLNPLALQITVFACGGFCLGARVHHAMCDGLGATQFFSAAAKLVPGAATRPNINPVWDRAELLAPRIPGRVEVPFDQLLKLDKGFTPYAQNTGPVQMECFNISNESVDRFKAMLFEKSGVKFTTFEALGAFIWRARVKANGLPVEKLVKFAYPTNIRKLVKPPLPAGYWGNGCVPIYVQRSAKDLTTQPIWETATLIKKSKFCATDEYVRSFVVFQQLHYDKGITAGDAVSAFTDWRHLGHSDVDFGWGGPVTIVPLSRELLGSVELCFFLPHSNAIGDGGEGKRREGFKVLVWLKKSAAPAFRVDMESFCNHTMSLM